MIFICVIVFGYCHCLLDYFSTSWDVSNESFVWIFKFQTAFVSDFLRYIYFEFMLKLDFKFLALHLIVCNYC
jgi:hypothetical protein